MERMSREPKISHRGKVSLMVPTMQSMIATAAATISGTISNAFLFHRSTKVPMNGLTRTIGSMARMVAMLKMVAEPDF